jgi:hypothetical protein
MGQIFSRWREIKHQEIESLEPTAKIENAAPEDEHGRFGLLAIHKCCLCIPEFRASDYLGVER